MIVGKFFVLGRNCGGGVRTPRIFFHGLVAISFAKCFSAFNGSSEMFLCSNKSDEKNVHQNKRNTHHTVKLKGNELLSDTYVFFYVAFLMLIMKGSWLLFIFPRPKETVAQRTKAKKGRKKVSNVR